MVKLTGGGIQGSKVVQSRSGQKVEPVTHKANVGGVAQQGMAVQFKKEPLTQGKGYEPKAMGPTGVPGRFNAATSGPGSQRTIHPTGSQSEYGPVAQGSVNRAPDVPGTTPGRDILSDYGPGRRGR
jgi:hypothetical protein